MEPWSCARESNDVDLLLATSRTVFQMADIVPTLDVSREEMISYSHLKLHCLRVRDCLSLASRTSLWTDTEDVSRTLVELGSWIHRPALEGLPANATLEARLHAFNISWNRARCIGHHAEVDFISRWARLGSFQGLMKSAEKALEGYADTLEKKQPRTSSRNPDVQLSSAKPYEPTGDIRNLAQGLFDALLDWKTCACPQGHAFRAKLKMATYRRSDATPKKKPAIRPSLRRNMRNDAEAAGNLDFDMFLSKEHDWHEVHVQTVTDTGMGTIAESTTSPQTVSRRQPRRKAETLCKSIENTQSDAWQRLVLRFKKDQLSYVGIERSTFWIDKGKEPVSLLELLEERHDYFTEKTKRILSLIIGYAVLHLDGTHWLQRSWGSADIKFFQTTSHKTPLQPYIQVNLSKPNTAADSASPTKDCDDKDANELDSGHRCPALIALAVVLMEVHFAKPLERLAQISGVPLETRCRRVTLQDVVDVLDGVEDNEVNGWREVIPDDSALLIAIDNCLTPELWEDDQGDVLDSRTLKSRIYDRVIRLLEQHLTSGFSTIPLDGVDGYAKQMDFGQWGQTFSDQEPGVLMPHRGQRPPTAVHSVLPAATLPLRGRARIQPAVPELEDFICQCAQATSTASKSSFIMDTTSVRDLAIGCKNSRFFDDETAADGEPSNARTRAYLRWRCEYEKVYDKFIFTYLRDSSPSNPVKIAILDTGIDRDHPDFDAREDRIKARRNCYNESQKNTPDLNGHGTFTASLILDYARDADLYVAKIADRDNTTPNAGSVAKAINYAVDEWKVDIISLSFGWPSIDFDGYDALDDAIAKADANKVLLFAAASNSGGRLPRAYPASSSHVICVHSTDTMGNASSFSPTAQPYSLNLATVGESVESAWPVLLSPESPALKKYVSSRSGTSYATPIMAGIAAFLLQYARLHLPEQAPSLQKKENMEALLRRCAERGSNYTPRDNYFYVALSLDRQTLFGRDLDKINDEILKALQR